MANSSDNTLYDQCHSLYISHNSIAQTWLESSPPPSQRREQARLSATIQANNVNRSATLCRPYGMHMTSGESLKYGSTPDHNQSAFENNRPFDGRPYNCVPYFENSVVFQHNQQQQPYNFQGINIIRSGVELSGEASRTISTHHTRKTDILDHNPPYNDSLYFNIDNEASQNTNMKETITSTVIDQTSRLETHEEQRDQDYSYQLHVSSSMQVHQPNDTMDLPEPAVDNYQNSNSSTPKLTYDESPYLGATPAHSRNGTGETDFSEMACNKIWSQQTDVHDTLNVTLENVPDSLKSMTRRSSQSSNLSTASSVSAASHRPARRCQSRASSRTDGIPGWKCIYADCPETYGRKEDLFNKHIFSYHFGNEVTYICRIGNHKHQSRSTSKHYVALRHILTCWRKFKHLYGSRYAGCKYPPSELWSIAEPDMTEFICGFEGCHEATSTKKKLEEHVWREHDRVNPTTLTYECPYCLKVLEHSRSEYFRKHKKECA